MINKTVIELIRKEVPENPTLIDVSNAIVNFIDNYPDLSSLVEREDLSIIKYRNELVNPGSHFVANEAMWNFYQELSNMKTPKDEINLIMEKAKVESNILKFRSFGENVKVEFNQDSILKTSNSEEWCDIDEEYKISTREREVEYGEYCEKVSTKLLNMLSLEQSVFDLTIEKTCRIALITVFAWNFY